MYSAMILRVGSEILHATMGGFALFCLYYASQLFDPDVVRHLIIEAVISGGMATAVVYCKGKYLDG
jgi:hypothetical protein